jgi:acyl-CoA synthetase (AMP-forming)/AMP-acid ligase II
VTDKVLRSEQLAEVPTPAGSADDAGAPAVAIGPDTPVAQLYTSGTTGLPKGVVLAHRSFFAVLSSLRRAGLDWITVTSEDRCFVGIPGFHVGGLWFATQAVNAGAQIVALPEFDPVEARRLIADARVTSGIFVPAMLRALLDAAPAGPDDLSSLGQTIYGGAPISDTLLERCLREIGGRFAQIYGLTETGNTAICLPPQDHVVGSARLRAAGRPYPCVQVEVRDDRGRPVANGEVGEV